MEVRARGRSWSQELGKEQGWSRTGTRKRGRAWNKAGTAAISVLSTSVKQLLGSRAGLVMSHSPSESLVGQGVQLTGPRLRCRLCS